MCHVFLSDRKQNRFLVHEVQADKHTRGEYMWSGSTSFNTAQAPSKLKHLKIIATDVTRGRVDDKRTGESRNWIVGWWFVTKIVERARRLSTWIEVLLLIGYTVSQLLRNLSGGMEQKTTGYIPGGSDCCMKQIIILRRQTIIIGDSKLRRMEREFSRGHKDNRMVCCLPWVKIWIVSTRLGRIIKSSGSSPLVVIHIGTNDSASCGTTQIIDNFRDLGRELKMRKSKCFSWGLFRLHQWEKGRQKILEVKHWLW